MSAFYSGETNESIILQSCCRSLRAAAWRVPNRYSQEYFETFWKRNYSDQSWLPLNKGSSFTAKRGITTALTEMGYEETLLVDGKTIKSTLWFYGELDPCNLGNNTH